ncbi:membrane-bound transcriptional regulator LytR [Caldibacillus thermoamylovorans]|uniref:Membrane-bound transcriptional regulator LytR n=1 Tax=Caldibacillus thermoamylovorans TaxID=35841 RepID=A0A090IY72_9BACI|nr:membrane-bound transcriptional regulator LytR [Caldibacillus thermoamylovorans]
MSKYMRDKNRSQNRRKKRRLRRWVKLTLTIILLLVVAVIVYAHSIYNHAKSTVNDEMNIVLDSIDQSETRSKIENREILNVLLLGVDERAEVDGSRSDTIIVVSLDPKNEKLRMVSIPRDTRVTISGEGTKDRINAAYSYGGADMAIKTVEDFLDIDLDYYVEMNMQGLADLVDAIGGITVNNEIEWYDEGFYKKGYHFKKGEIELDGAKTIGYVRMRHLDPKGDFGRTERQRKVIKAIIDKGISFTTVAKMNDLIDVVGDNMQTNMKFKDMKALLAKNYINVTNNIESYMIQGKDNWINGIYYYAVSDQEITKVHNMVKGKSVEKEVTDK